MAVIKTSDEDVKQILNPAGYHVYAGSEILNVRKDDNGNTINDYFDWFIHDDSVLSDKNGVKIGAVQSWNKNIATDVLRNYQELESRFKDANLSQIRESAKDFGVGDNTKYWLIGFAVIALALVIYFSMKK